MTSRYIPTATSIEIPLRDTDEVSVKKSLAVELFQSESALIWCSFDVGD